MIHRTENEPRSTKRMLQTRFKLELESAKLLAHEFQLRPMAFPNVVQLQMWRHVPLNQSQCLFQREFGAGGASQSRWICVNHNKQHARSLTNLNGTE